MAEGLQQQAQEEEDYVIAFKSGNKLVAEQLLPRIPQPAAITTTFEFSSRYGPSALVSLLHLASYWGWRNVVTALVSVYKCAANCKDEEGHIPLHYAAYNGHLEVVKYFVIELLCDSMDRNNYGRTPLHYACDNGHLNIAQYLIREEHCNPSCEDKYGDTPLHYACRHGYLNIAQYLLAAGPLKCRRLLILTVLRSTSCLHSSFCKERCAWMEGKERNESHNVLHCRLFLQYPSIARICSVLLLQ